MYKPLNFFDKFLKKYFNEQIGFRAQIFNMLGVIGTVLGIITAIISFLTHAWVNVVINSTISIMTVILLWIANTTKKFELYYSGIIIAIFIVIFPALFFTAGGYRSAMPCYFIFAIAFTGMMLKGKRRLIITAVEIAMYIGICLIAWQFPQTVTMAFTTERNFMLEIISGFVFVGIALWVALMLLMKLYDRKQAQLEQLNKMKTEFWGNVSHEMKTPLAVISGYAQTLRNELRSFPQTKEAISKSRLIVAEADRLALIISQILDMTKIDEGSMTMITRKASVVEIIQDTLNIYGPALHKNSNQLILRLDENLPPVTADAAHLSRVLVNLLSNAVRHTQEGVVTVSAQKKADFVAVTVADTGEGIAEEVWPYLFDRYNRRGYGADGKKARAGNDTGTGLGLYICKYIVEAHGGVITAENGPDCGARFSFTIPIHT